MNFPQELKYTQEHEWVKVEGDTLLIGITEFAQRELGDIIFIELSKAIGDTISKDEAFGVVEAVKTVSDLFMPVDSIITEFNNELANQTELLNSHPYDSWIIKAKAITLADVDSLLTADEYKKLVGC